jgi:hypothetical protein
MQCFSKTQPFQCRTKRVIAIKIEEEGRNCQKFDREEEISDECFAVRTINKI